MYFTYMLECYLNTKKQYYIGYTKDLSSRLSLHLSNKVKSTKKYRKKRLVYYELHDTSRQARARERFLKNYNNKKKIIKKINDIRNKEGINIIVKVTGGLELENIHEIMARIDRVQWEKVISERKKRDFINWMKSIDGERFFKIANREKEFYLENQNLLLK